MRLALALVLTLSLVSAAYAGVCGDACRSSYGAEVKDAANKLSEKGYYFGVEDTNCLRRENVSRGSQDPCWSIGQNCSENCSGDGRYACVSDCDASFQACCNESAVINAGIALDACLSACNATTVPANNQTTLYDVDITTSGPASITDLNGKPIQALGNSSTYLITGDEGSIYIIFKAPDGSQALQLHMGQDTGFRFDAGSCPLNFNQSGPATAANPSQGKGVCRGVMNGGGGFDTDIGPNQSTGQPASTGSIEVDEDTTPGEAGFELEISLPDGDIFVNSTNGQADYSATLREGGVELAVGSGDVDATSSVGGHLHLGKGESAFVDASNLTAPATGLQQPNASVQCTGTNQCQGALSCVNGKCVEPQCLPSSAIIVACALGAAFIGVRARNR